jgi:GNAT superfamily N-acetyltransferase
MEIAFAQRESIPVLAALWAECFGDPEDYAERVLSLCMDRKNSGVLAAFSENCPVAMACLVEVKLTAAPQVPGAYIYAVCTRPDFRSRGLCKAILSRAKELYEFLCLVPARPALAPFYRSLGFTHPLRVPVAFAGQDAPLKKADPLSLTVAPDFEAICREVLSELTEKAESKAPSDGIPDSREAYEISSPSGRMAVLLDENGLCTPHPALPAHPIAGLLPL